MHSLYRPKGSPYYYVRTDPITGQPKSTRKTKKKEAFDWCEDRRRKADDPAYRATQSADLGTWCDRTYEKKRLAGKSKGTLQMYKSKLGNIVSLLGRDRRLVTITPTTFDQYWAARSSEGVKDVTVAKELVCLRQVLKAARRAGEYTGDVSALWPEGLSLISTPSKRWFKPEELPKLRAVCKPNEWAWILAGIVFGGRLSEINRFRKEDYDPERGVVFVRGTKTKKSEREIPILDIFQPLWEEALPHLPAVWRSPSKRLPERCKAAGLEHASPNALRHTHGTWLRLEGVSTDLIGSMLGHTTPGLAYNTYASVGGSDLGTAIRSVRKTSDLSPPQDRTDRENSLVAPPGVEPGLPKERDFKSKPRQIQDNKAEHISGTYAPQATERNKGSVRLSSDLELSPATLGYAALHMGVLPAGRGAEL